MYKTGLEAKKAGDAAREQECQTAFHELFRREMVWFHERAASEREARGELRLPRIEAAMMEGRFDPVKAVFYQEGLERRSERKWKLFERYRRTRCRAQEQVPDVQSEAASAGDRIMVEDQKDSDRVEQIPPDAASVGSATP